MDQAPPPIPDYDLLRPLGAGRFGTVWLARSRTGVHYAVKVVPKGDVEALELEGLRTFEVVARRHPALIDVRHVGETEDALFYVMELADGYETAPTFSAEDYEPRTLETDLARQGALSFDEAVSVALALADGLEHLHRNGLLHRDVKPGNVVFVGGRPQLADLGLVTAANRRRGEAGTPLYMPPETVVDAGGDVYCLGRVLFEVVTGAEPGTFPELPDDMTASRADAYRRLAPILDRACAPDRSERYASAAAVREDLAALTDRASEPSIEGTGSASTLPVWALAAAALLATVAAWWFASRDTADEAGSAAMSAEGAMTGSISLMYREDPDGVGGVAVSEESAHVPLQAGGSLWVKALLDAPAYPVVAYVDAESVQILYPDEGAQQEPRVVYESGEFPIEGADGTMTFVLLASAEPVEDLDAIREGLAALGDAPSCPPHSLLYLGASGVAEPRASLNDPTRGIGREDRSVPIPQAEIGLLNELPHAFVGRFPLVRALAVPQVPRNE